MYKSTSMNLNMALLLTSMLALTGCNEEGNVSDSSNTINSVKVDSVSEDDHTNVAVSDPVDDQNIDSISSPKDDLITSTDSLNNPNNDPIGVNDDPIDVTDGLINPNNTNVVTLPDTHSVDVNEVAELPTFDPSVPVNKAFILDTTIWDNKRIPVCWEEVDDSTLLGRNTTRLAILNSWEKHSGVIFTGWDQCQSNSDGIRIEIIDSSYKVPAVIGGLGNDIMNMRLNFTYNNWGSICKGAEAYCTSVIAVHEFGHILGFAHEQNRIDNPHEPGCIGFEQGSLGNVMIGSWDIESVMNYCNPKWNNGGELSATDIEAVQKYYGMPLVYKGFGLQHGNWKVDRHPRHMADVNGDGLEDIVGFGNRGVFVALSNGSGFDRAKIWTWNFGYKSGWRIEQHPRFLSDVNGDGKKDIVAFSDDNVQVAISNGSTFDDPQIWSSSFVFNRGGWSTKRHPRILADVNADGKDDIVGFGSRGVYVALSTGSGFQSAKRWTYGFGHRSGWEVDVNPRYLSDVNGDGKMDIVAFGNGSVQVAISNGSAFEYPKIWSPSFVAHRERWTSKRHPRMMADVNGDGKNDIVGFSDKGVYVALSTGSRFAKGRRWTHKFGYNGGWTVDKNPRYLSDINGDGKKDIVGIGDEGVYVAESTGHKFSSPQLKVKGYSADTSWTQETPRMMADIDGDNKQELVGFYLTGVSTFDDLD